MWRLELLGGPFGPAELFQPLGQLPPEWQQVSERRRRRIRSLLTVSGRRAQSVSVSAFDSCTLSSCQTSGRVAHRVAEPDQAGRDLQVEQVARRPAAAVPAHANLFPAGVDDDHPGRVGDQFPETVQRADGQRIDDEQPLGRRHLHQAKPRVKRVFADEFGVEAERGAAGEVVAAVGQAVRVIHELLGQVGHAMRLGGRSAA